MPQVSALNIFPIKGCKATPVPTAEITAFGLAGDRVFSVIQDGQRCGQKQIADLRQLSAEWRDNLLVLNYPSMATFKLSADQSGHEQQEMFRGQPVPVNDMGDEIAMWLSEALKQPVRLARQNRPTAFPIPLREFGSVNGAPQDRFMDAAPILLVNEASLQDLNSRMTKPVPMDRFRANIQVSDLAAYQEDEPAEFRFAEVTLNRVAVCERCTVTTIDQQNGSTTKEPLHTLSSYRKRSNHYAGGIMFGIYLTGGSGRLSVGDTLLI